MCTLTVLHDKHQYVVTMNRDEHLSRSETGALKVSNSPPLQIIYPQDDKELGTWLGINNYGLTGCLLNRYQDQHGEGKVTRGNIIPHALKAETLDEACRQVLGLDLNNYNPFDLFLMDRKHVRHLEWHGTGTHGNAEFIDKNSREFMFSSSSMKADEVISYRKAQFERWRTKRESEQYANQWLAQSVLNEFHIKQDDRYKTHAVLMEREHSHTKSICQVVVQSNVVQLDYYPQVLARGLSQPITKTVSAINQSSS